MKVVFLGTPDFAVNALEKIVASKHEVVAVVTQPDRPKGRGHEMTFSPVKECALKHNIKVLQYEKIRKEGVEDLTALNADIMVTCAYGQILSQQIIDIARFGIINIHASLLPGYRGSAPINWVIINGEEKTGVTIMKTVKAVDAGDVLMSREIDIKEDETAGELFERLSVLGSEMIVPALDSIENGTAVFLPQDESKATLFPMLSKEDGLIDFSKKPKEIVNKVRGMNPWPCAYFVLDNLPIKVFKAKECDMATNERNGTVIAADKKSGLIVSCGEGAVEIVELQYPSSKRMLAKDFLLGHSINVGKTVNE